MAEVNMPRFSDTMQEGTIARWLKQQGDEIKKGEIIAEIETDKATMDLESYDAGTLEQILVQEGETVPIGQPIARIGSGSGAGAQKREQPAEVKAEGSQGDRKGRPYMSSPGRATPAPSGSTQPDQPVAPQNDGNKDSSASGQPAQAERAQDEQTSAQQKQMSASEESNGASLKVSPLARRMAEEYGIDLRQISGSGPGGRIVRDDIEDFREQQGQQAGGTQTAQPEQVGATWQPNASWPRQARPLQTNGSASEPGVQEPAPTNVVAELASAIGDASAIAPSSAIGDASAKDVPASAQATGATADEIVKLSRMQAVIARRLTESKQTIPHFYVRNDVNMTEALVLRQTLNGTVGEDGVKVSVNDLIVKAAALALEKFPEVNSSLKDGQFIRHKQINVGIAIDVPAGLVVPVIRDANIKGVRSIAREAKVLIEKARANKLSQSDLEGGTFSVSNLGMMDVSDFIAVINPPEAAILAVASTRKQYVPVDGQPVIQDLMPLTLSADHRILYGATVARFLQEVKRLLEKPYSLLG